MEIKAVSVDSVIICFKDEISKEVSSQVALVFSALEALNNKHFIDIIPSYSTILLTYDIFAFDYKALKKYLLENISLNKEKELKSEIITIDVYYGKEVALDLEQISKNTSLSIEEIVKIHSEKLYDIYAVGFLPGFAYMASVDKRIARPRLKSPRKEIPKNSVAIADTQTAVYPQASPGGWNVIGRTAFELFNKDLDSLCPLNVGDKVKFNSISKEEFLSQGGVL